MKLKELRLFNYIEQIGRPKVNVNQEHLISRDLISERYRQLEEGLCGNARKSSSITFFETATEIKLSYIAMLLSLKECDEEAFQNPYKLTEKKEIIKRANDISRLGREKAMLKEGLQNEDIKKYNAYNDLNIRVDYSKEKVAEKYKQQLELLLNKLNQNIEENSFTKEDIIVIQAIYLGMKVAFQTLSNPVERVNLDESIMLNFNPNREDLFQERNISELTYVPQREIKDENLGKKVVPMFFAHNSRGDEFIIEPTATVGFGKYRQQSGKITYESPYALTEYTIIKKYENKEFAESRKKEIENGNTQTEWDEMMDGEKFVVYGNIDYKMLSKKNTDPEYLRYNMDVLLSNINLENAIKYNGGYIGEVRVDTNTKEYVVGHDQDNLCTARKIQEIRRKNKITRPTRIPLDTKKYGYGEGDGR